MRRKKSPPMELTVFSKTPPDQYCIKSERIEEILQQCLARQRRLAQLEGRNIDEEIIEPKDKE